ncbi:MAG: hypothetical protein R3C60_03665 [Parvularculaceae bacterium]
MKLISAGLLTGLAGGALDAIAASTIYPLAYKGLTLTRLWQGVAAGWFGKASYDMGAKSVAIGLASHFLIALCAGAALTLVMAQSEIFRRRWPISGALYGVAMYFFMQKIVLPLSAIGPQHPDAKSMAIGLGIHIFIFGMGSALVASRLLKESS